MSNTTLTLPMLLELLKDVGRFVAETLSGEKLSEKASARRQALVQKLCVYLPETFPPYLDMTATQATGLVSNEPPVDRSEYVGADKQPVEEEEYEEFPPPTTPPQPRAETPIPQISFNDLRTTSPKCGPLNRAERRFFRDVFPQYMVGISEQRMLFYERERDMKPTFVQDIAGFQARAAPNIVKNPKKKDSCFEVICPGKKTTQVQLIARTVKDMEQWVAAINKVGRAIVVPNDSPALRRRQLPSIPDSDTSETYDDIDGQHTEKQKPAPVPVATVTVEVPADEEEEIYHDISIPSGEDSDRESIYDDVGSYPISVYYNMGKETTLPLPKQFKEVNHETPPPPLPQSNSSRADEAEEIYDDIPAHNETPPLPFRPLKEVTREPSSLPKPHPPKEEEAEEMYDDISANKETHSLKKTFKQVSQESPQFPKPHPPKAEEVEEMYDDISANKETHSLKKTFKQVSQESPQLPKPHPPKEEEAEEMYDDISANKEKLPQTIKKQTPRESTGNGIQGLIGKLNLEATLGRNNQKIVPGYCHRLLPNNNVNEPVHSTLPKTQSKFRPHLATKPKMTKK